MSAELKRQLESEEDRVPYAYLDSLGYTTIGVGRLIDKRKGGCLRDSEIDFMINNDINAMSAELLISYPWMASLTPARFDAMMQMRFQLGEHGLAGFISMLAYMKASQWDSAAAQMRNSNWYKQTPGRVERLASQITNDVYQYKPGF